VRVDDVIGPVYATTPFVQRGHGIGSFLSGLFRMIRPIFVSGAKAVGRESLRTGGKILSDIAANKASDVEGVRDILAKHVSESAQGLIHKALSGRGTKRKRGGGGARATTSRRTAARKSGPPAKTGRRRTLKPRNKSDIFS
jgi:hypothetical protein